MTSIQPGNFEGHTDGVIAVAISPDGKQVLSRSTLGDESIRLWDVTTGKEVRRLDFKPAPVESWGTLGIAFSPDGKLAASAGPDNAVRLWDVATGKLKSSLTWKPEAPGDGGPLLAYSPDGAVLVSGHGPTGVVRIWDTRTSKLLHTFQAHPTPIKAVAFSPDGKILATGGYKDSIKLWANKWSSSSSNE